MRIVQRPSRQDGQPPVHTAVALPGAPPVAVMRLDAAHMARMTPHSHAHDFPTLVYIEHSAPVGFTGAHHVQAGDLYVVAPGDVVRVDEDPAALADAGAWCVHFLPEGIDSAVPGALLPWRAHPLLGVFARRCGRGVLRLSVPPADRAAWSARITCLNAELRDRRGGYREASLAHLVLLLVDVARLAGDTGTGACEDSLLTEVFAVIDSRFAGPLSLRDVARAVNLTSGHVTTTVSRRTGRSVGAWIVERRMAESRRLLTDTAMTVEQIARAVGLPDASYFARCFRRAHGMSPRDWRRNEHAARHAVGATPSAS